MISTRNTKLLPNKPRLQRLTKTLAMLDAILMPEWEDRYHSYVQQWAIGIDLYTMRNGSGDDICIVFNDTGVVIKGFAHESEISPYQREPLQVNSDLFIGLPDDLRKILENPSLEIVATTFCLWQLNNQSTWQHAKLPEVSDKFGDGSDFLLEQCEDKAEVYWQFAEEYLEIDVNLDIVKHIYAYQPINAKLIRELNPDADVEAVFSEAKEIGYPIEEGGS